MLNNEIEGMDISILGQGFNADNENSVGNKLLQLLEDGEFHTFTAISAFASETGIGILSEKLKKASGFATVNMIIGVNQKATSKEALEMIVSLPVNGYVFYFGKSPIFHPKIYLFEGDKQSHLIIGSSNLTGSGLFSNVETSTYITLDSTSESDLQTIQDLKGYFKGLFEFDDPNLQPLNAELIAELVKDKVVPTEKERNKAYGELNAEKRELGGVLSKLFPQRKTSSVPNVKQKTRKRKAVGDQSTDSNSQAAQIQIKELLWEKKRLTQSDAQQVPTGTAVTANVKLSQARFKYKNELINHLIYFRDFVFHDLEWEQTQPNNTEHEEATCLFEVEILRENLGQHAFKISHDPKREANQGNTTTWLHWGEEMSVYLRKNNVQGKALRIYGTDHIGLFKLIIS